MPVRLETPTATAKVQRFSPQDLMALRRAPTRPLGKMPILGADISVIVSEEPLEPVTATPADEEAISKARYYSTILYKYQDCTIQQIERFCLFLFLSSAWEGGPSTAACLSTVYCVGAGRRFRPFETRLDTTALRGYPTREAYAGTEDGDDSLLSDSPDETNP